MRFFDINVIEQIEYLRVPQSFILPLEALIIWRGNYLQTKCLEVIPAFFYLLC